MEVLARTGSPDYIRTSTPTHCHTLGGAAIHSEIDLLMTLYRSSFRNRVDWFMGISHGAAIFVRGHDDVCILSIISMPFVNARLSDDAPSRGCRYSV